tara:strand:+ start:4770 stop:5318 length:549 start_codon:yes stop_codon:yes gene_type:complete
MLEIKRHLERPISLPIFFLECKINIQPKYFIDKIEEGIKHESNENFKTNVIGEMTSYTWFNRDKNFWKALQQGLDYIDQTDLYKMLPKSILKESWGIKTGYRHKVKDHNHWGARISGVLYLNDSDQNLFFPQLNIEVKPETGKLILFTSILDHHTNLQLEKKNKYAISFNMFERWLPTETYS